MNEPTNLTVAGQYINILPEVYRIEASSDISREESKRQILALAMKALQKAKTLSFDKHRMDLLKCRTDKDIVRLLEKTVEKGRKHTQNG